MNDICLYVPLMGADPAVQLRWTTMIDVAVENGVEAGGLQLRIEMPDAATGLVSDESLDAIAEAVLVVVALPVLWPFAALVSGMRLGARAPVVHLAEATDVPPLDPLEAEYLFFNPADPRAGRTLSEQLRRRAAALCGGGAGSGADEQVYQSPPPYRGANGSPARGMIADASAQRRRQLGAAAGLIDAFVDDPDFRRVALSGRTGGLIVHAAPGFKLEDKPTEFEGVQVEYRFD